MDFYFKQRVGKQDEKCDSQQGGNAIEVKGNIYFHILNENGERLNSLWVLQPLCPSLSWVVINVCTHPKKCIDYS